MTTYVNMNNINGPEFMYMPTREEHDEALRDMAEFNRNHPKWWGGIVILACVSGATCVFSAVVLLSCDIADDSHGFCGDGWGIVAAVSAAAFCGLCGVSHV